MAQKADWTYWKTGLHQDSDALADLDILAKDLGVSRAEASRFLLIAYSKARRGEWNSLFRSFQPHEGILPTPPAPARQQNEKEAEVQARRSKGAKFAKALDLD